MMVIVHKNGRDITLVRVAGCIGGQSANDGRHARRIAGTLPYGKPSNRVQAATERGRFLWLDFTGQIRHKTHQVRLCYLDGAYLQWLMVP